MSVYIHAYVHTYVHTYIHHTCTSTQALTHSRTHARTHTQSLTSTDASHRPTRAWLAVANLLVARNRPSKNVTLNLYNMPMRHINGTVSAQSFPDRHRFCDAPSVLTSNQTDSLRDLGASWGPRGTVLMTHRCVDMLWSCTNRCPCYEQIATTMLWI